MPTKRTLIFIALLFVISFLATFFMIRSNDHKECEIVIKKELDKNGIEVTKEEHVCKEKYSF
ncbi:hypothetical protein QLS91_00735 [Flavobacterium sp. LB2P84]|jgi:hypothetical protein|uniref:hypothetical protein n=1 Tax=Flavobacterium yafengii TaxID=3041253 RepID=UPI0024A8D73B|nr:hypothetical protein [Flavobacterium yafengii]MDI6031588.1 hypothetical protein [Flavobacterium yafengii]